MKIWLIGWKSRDADYDSDDHNSDDDNDDDDDAGVDGKSKQVHPLSKCITALLFTLR